MKWLLMAVAFVLGAAVTWLVTVKRVTKDVPIGSDAGGEDRGGEGMASTESHEVTDPIQEGGGGTETPVDEGEDASRFGGEHTSSTASPRVGWDEDAEDIDALLTDDEKSGADRPGQRSPEEA
jgi:hypothetical protein